MYRAPYLLHQASYTLDKGFDQEKGMDGVRFNGT
jgi:hypothetical protein